MCLLLIQQVLQAIREELSIKVEINVFETKLDALVSGGAMTEDKETAVIEAFTPSK